MDTKDIILIVISMVSTATAIVAFIFVVVQYRKKRKLLQEMSKYHQKQIAALNNYRRHISQKFQYLDFTGLNTILKKPLLLQDIYVKIRTKRYYESIKRKTIVHLGDIEVNKSGEDFAESFKKLHDEYLRKQESLKLVIFGHPGSGKTILMKWIALQCTINKESYLSWYIPVFIQLKDFGLSPENTYKKYNIKELIIHLSIIDNISPDFFNDAFDNNRLILLLDGLDEVADETNRREVIEWIQKQNIQDNILLVTSRFSAMQESKGLKFHDAIPVLAIQNFNLVDIEHFLKNWYKNIEVVVLEKKNENDKTYAIEKSGSKYDDLINIIKDEKYKHLRQLAVNPLLLTIIAIVHRTRAVLPKERHKLYEESLKVMIEFWNVANKKLEINFPVESSMNNLAKIAVSLMETNRLEIEISGIRKLFIKVERRQTLDLFLNEMVLKAGLLYESGKNYGFVHLTFQEYLTAFYFAKSENQNEILLYRDKDYWIETFKLFINIADVNLFFDEIIENLFKFEKNYWWHISLWIACLNELADGKTRREFQMKLVKKIMDFSPDAVTKWGSYSESELPVHLSHLSLRELKEFQYNNPEFVAEELSRGNFNILAESSIFPETLDKVEKCVQFDIKTIEKLLNFKVNFENQKENLLPIRAFLILKRADFKKMRELMVHVIQYHEDEKIRINALYIFKKVN